MKPKLKARHLILKQTSDDLVSPGDYYLRNLGSVDEKIKPVRAVILNCPFCGVTMATTTSHKIKESTIRARNIFERILFSLLRYQHGVTVSPMLQCPYNRSHQFKIKNSRIIPLWQR